MQFNQITGIITFFLILLISMTKNIYSKKQNFENEIVTNFFPKTYTPNHRHTYVRKQRVSAKLFITDYYTKNNNKNIYVFVIVNN